MGHRSLPALVDRKEEFLDCCAPSVMSLDLTIRDYCLLPVPVGLLYLPATLVCRIWQFTHAELRFSSPKGMFPLGDFSNRVESSCEETPQR